LKVQITTEILGDKVSSSESRGIENRRLSF
jgi:hypothetical protein